MKQLYFARHGVTSLNQDKCWSGSMDIPLAPDGQEQAILAGEQAAEKKLFFDLIVSSDQLRARSTAERIAAAQKYPIKNIAVSALFRERHFGSLEGKPHTLRVNALYAFNEASIDKYGSEPYAALKDRARDALEFLKSQDADKILVVSHSAFGRALYRTIYPKKRRYLPFKNAEIVRFL